MSTSQQDSNVAVPTTRRDSNVTVPTPQQQDSYGTVPMSRQNSYFTVPTSRQDSYVTVSTSQQNSNHTVPSSRQVLNVAVPSSRQVSNVPVPLSRQVSNVTVPMSRQVSNVTVPMSRQVSRVESRAREQRFSQVYRKDYRNYLIAMLVFMMVVTTYVIVIDSSNWGAIIACLVSMLLLGLWLVYAHYVWQRYQYEHRTRLASLARREHDARVNYYGAQRSRMNTTGYYTNFEENIFPQPVYTITVRHDPPPHYDDVVKDQTITDFPTVQPSSLHLQSLANNRSTVSSLSDSVIRLSASASSSASLANDATEEQDDALPPTYSDALATRLTQQLQQ